MIKNQPLQEKETSSLKDLLKNDNENLFFHIPFLKNEIHHHYSILVWLITNLKPKKIAIFDNDIERIIHKNICEIIDSFELSSQCFSEKQKKESHYSYPNILLPIKPNISDYDCIFINSLNQSLKKAPIINSLYEKLPENTTILIDNIFSDHSIAKENSSIITAWQTQYPHFDFYHYSGLTILYTGTAVPFSLKNLFDLSYSPILAQRFQKKCAFFDQYWSMYNSLDKKNEASTPSLFLESKIEQNLLGRKLQYSEKEIANQTQKIREKNKILKDLTNQVAKTGCNKKLIFIKNLYPKSISEIIYRQLKRKTPVFVKKYIKNKIKMDINAPNFINVIKRKFYKENNIIGNSLPSSNSLHSMDSLNYFARPDYNSYNPIRKILFVAGEPDTPGVIYRCYRNAKACIMAGHEAKVSNAADVSVNDIQWADIIILWRVEFSGHIDGILKLSKEYNKLTAFDVDDIVFKPHFAHIEIIDGIRTIGTTEAKTAHTFHNMRQTLIRSDFAIATTKEMREHMAQELIPRHAGPLVYTLPNIFDDECVKLSRFAARIVQATKNDDYIRIGYASGTRTHQRDFALVIPALISIFQQRSNVRLVLFREPVNHRPILHMNEFPELKNYENFIEWRDTVPLEKLPQELARFDISIAPLEIDNVFCNAKSELKYFEAALANVCSIVSPTQPLKRCIQHGITGYLASTAKEWEEYLLSLIDNKTLRKEMAQNAYHAVLWNFSLQRQSKLCDTMLLSLINEKGAAQAAETIISRKNYNLRNLPVIPHSNILFEHDNLRESEVTVVITSYNYEQYILEALESVFIQTLKDIDLIIVDDGSSDESITLILEWSINHKHRFNRLQIHQSVNNVGLGGARNIGIAASETLYSMQLDADNRLMPDTCEKLLQAIQNTNIGYAYPEIQHFGAGEAIGGHVPFNPLRLTVGNYIDAMVLIAKWAWAAAGGFYVKRDAMGWEDFDMWCSLAEMGINGKQVTNTIAEYRAHFASMTNVLTEQNTHKPKVVSHLENRHPWLDLVYPEISPWNKKQ